MSRNSALKGVSSYDNSVTVQQPTHRLGTLDKLQRHQHSNLQAQRDLLAKQVKHGQDRVQMINKDELESRMNGKDFAELRHRRISSLKGYNNILGEQEQIPEKNVGFMLPPQNQKQKIGATELQEIVNSAHSLSTIDVNQMDLRPQHMDDRVYPVIEPGVQRQNTPKILFNQRRLSHNLVTGSGESNELIYDNMDMFPNIDTDRGVKSCAEVLPVIMPASTPNRRKNQSNEKLCLE